MYKWPSSIQLRDTWEYSSEGLKKPSYSFSSEHITLFERENNKKKQRPTVTKISAAWLCCYSGVPFPWRVSLDRPRRPCSIQLVSAHLAPLQSCVFTEGHDVDVYKLQRHRRLLCASLFPAVDLIWPPFHGGIQVDRRGRIIWHGILLAPLWSAWPHNLLSTVQAYSAVCMRCMQNTHNSIPFRGK